LNNLFNAFVCTPVVYYVWGDDIAVFMSLLNVFRWVLGMFIVCYG